MAERHGKQSEEKEEKKKGGRDGPGDG
jgi:hypothetical protein